MAKKANATAEVVSEENVAITNPLKKIPARKFTMVSMTINSKGQHGDYIAFRLDQLPKLYKPAVKLIPGAYLVAVQFQDTAETNKHFITKYLAGMAAEIRMLDESNLKIEYGIMPELANKSTVVE